jgi:hypothetical protein
MQLRRSTGAMLRTHGIRPDDRSDPGFASVRGRDWPAPKREGSNMFIKFNDTQLVLLSAASQRDDHCLVPPTGPKRSQAQKAVAITFDA